MKIFVNRVVMVKFLLPSLLVSLLMLDSGIRIREIYLHEADPSFHQGRGKTVRLRRDGRGGLGKKGISHRPIEREPSYAGYGEYRAPGDSYLE